MNTPIKYHGGTEFVPYPPYRCKATMAKPEKPNHTHHCRRHVDHGRKHKCICEVTWDPVGEEYDDEE